MNVLAFGGIDERAQQLAMLGYLTVTWKDDFLKWNPSNYSNTTSIYRKSSDLWTPYICLYNAAGSNLCPYSDKHAVIDYMGNVSIWPFEVFKVSCSLKILNFPFDKQSCSSIFTSWTYGSSRLTLEPTSPVPLLKQYTQNAEWDLVGGSANGSNIP